MKKIFTLLFMCFGIYVSHSQGLMASEWEKGRVILRTGDTLSGEVKLNLPMYQRIKFREEGSNKKKKMDHKDVKRIALGSGFQRIYEYKITPGRRDMYLLRRIAQGRLYLYSRFETRPSGPSFNFDRLGSSDVSNGGKRKYYYYMAENNSDFAKLLPDQKDELMKFFNDCPEVLKYLRPLKRNDIDFQTAVNTYNVHCTD